MSDFQLSINEETSQVTFNTTTLSGARAGLAELKRRKKLYTIKKREAFSRVREHRVLYRGHQAIGKFRTSSKDPLGGLIAAIANFCNGMRKIKKYEEMAHSEIDVSKIDRVIAAIDKAVIQLEDEIAKAKSS